MSSADPSPPSASDSDEPIELTVEDRAHGWRLDHYVSRLYPNYSRSLFQKAISDGLIRVNGLAAKSSRRLHVNDRLSVTLPKEPDSSIEPEAIPLEILFEDEHLVVINKPAGMIVHPGKANYGGTLANALQAHFDELSDIAGQHRPGIVHRLDRDTSGLLVVAKNNQVHHRLSRQFEQREVKKTYLAVVHGVVDFDSDYIETHVRVHSKQREKMSVCPPGNEAREAVTFYEVIERFPEFTFVRLHPKTGRTHQLRLHMSHLGHPIIADRMYGGGTEVRLGDITEVEEGQANRVLIRRQALHAYRLEFTHPDSGQNVAFEAPLASDIQEVVDGLQRQAGQPL